MDPLMYYFYPQPPYFLLIAGLLAGATSGLAFKASLEQLVQAWNRDRSINLPARAKEKELFIPFVGIGCGICAFLSSGLQIFGFPASIAILFAVPLGIGTCGLVWWQLGKLLEMLVSGGSKALDLDSF